MMIFCGSYLEKTGRIFSKGEIYLLQVLKFSSFSVLLLSFLIVNLFTAKPQYILLKIVNSFSEKLQKIFIEIIEKILSFNLAFDQKTLNHPLNPELEKHHNILMRSLRDLKDFLYENIQRSVFINSWDFCINFETKKIFFLNNCDQKTFYSLNEFIENFNKVNIFLSDEKNSKFFMKWPLIQLNCIEDLSNHNIVLYLHEFFSSQVFFSQNRLFIWRNSLFLFFRTIIINLLVYCCICFPIMLYTKKLYAYIRNKESTILNEIPITIIDKFSFNKTLESTGLYFPEEQKKEIYFVDYLVNNFKDFSFCFQGEKGTGKTETAKYICAKNGGGYLVSLSKMTLMEEEGIKFFYELIKDCMNNGKILIIDDSEGVMISRDILYQKDISKKEEAVKTIVIALLSVLSFHKFNCIFVTNNTKEIDEAFARRVYMLHFKPYEESFKKLLDKNFNFISSAFRQIINNEFSKKISYRSLKLLSHLYENSNITRKQLYYIFQNISQFEQQNEISLKREEANIAISS